MVNINAQMIAKRESMYVVCFRGCGEWEIKFLITRPSSQIENRATRKSKVIYNV